LPPKTIGSGALEASGQPSGPPETALQSETPVVTSRPGYLQSHQRTVTAGRREGVMHTVENMPEDFATYRQDQSARNQKAFEQDVSFGDALPDDSITTEIAEISRVRMGRYAVPPLLRKRLLCQLS